MTLPCKLLISIHVLLFVPKVTPGNDAGLGIFKESSIILGTLESPTLNEYFTLDI